MKKIVCLFVLMLNVPVNNFSVMSGRNHRFPDITSTFRGVKKTVSTLEFLEVTVTRSDINQPWQKNNAYINRAILLSVNSYS